MEYLTRQEKEAFAILYARKYCQPGSMVDLRDLDNLERLAKAGFDLMHERLAEERRRQSKIDELHRLVESDTDSKIISDLKKSWPR